MIRLSYKSEQSLLQATHGLASAETIDKLSLPQADTELELLSYICCRVQPAMPRLVYSSVGKALSALKEHFNYHANAKLAINTRSDSSIDLLLLTKAGQGEQVICPWTYGAPQ